MSLIKVRLSGAERRLTANPVRLISYYACGSISILSISLRKPQ